MLDVEVPLHDEAERWGLAGAIGEHLGVEAAELVPEVLGLEAGEGHADLEVQLLPRRHGQRLALVRRHQGLRGQQGVRSWCGSEWLTV